MRSSSSGKGKKQERELHSYSRRFVRWSRYTVLLLILVTIVLLLAFTVLEIYGIARDMLHGSARNFLRDISYIIVLVKAYRVLLFYFETLHVSIRYVVEISIIAPAIEIVFASTGKSWWLVLLLGLFSILNLVVYLLLHKKIVAIDESVNMQRLKY